MMGLYDVGGLGGLSQLAYRSQRATSVTWEIDNTVLSQVKLWNWAGDGPVA